MGKKRPGNDVSEIDMEVIRHDDMRKCSKFILWTLICGIYLKTISRRRCYLYHHKPLKIDINFWQFPLCKCNDYVYREITSDVAYFKNHSSRTLCHTVTTFILSKPSVFVLWLTRACAHTQGRERKQFRT